MDNCGKIRDGFQKKPKSLNVANNTNKTEISDRKTNHLVMLEGNFSFGTIPKLCCYNFLHICGSHWPYSHELLDSLR